MLIKDLLKDNKELLVIFTSLGKLHDKYERDISVEELSLYVLFNCLEKDKETLSLLLKELVEVESQSEIIEDVLKEALSRQQAYELALLALEVSEGRSSFDNLLSATSSFETVTEQVGKTDFDFVSDNLFELVDDACNTPGLRWRLDCLNKSLGSLRKGDFGFVFARPETGKTTFLASEITYMAEQARTSDLGPILWFNNEEQGSKVKLRIFQAVFGIKLAALMSDMPTYNEKYTQLIGDHIKMHDSAAINWRTVEKMCEELKPSLVIVDQLDKLKGFSGDLRDDLRLGEIYIWGRELAKEYCPVIGICQSDGSGEGKKWLTMDNVANAKTAKQAEADWVLGIGKTHDPVEEYIRFLCISKNKLIGDLDSDPALRHGRLTVNILPDIARYGDIS